MVSEVVSGGTAAGGCVGEPEVTPIAARVSNGTPRVTASAFWLGEASRTAPARRPARRGRSAAILRFDELAARRPDPVARELLALEPPGSGRFATGSLCSDSVLIALPSGSSVR